MKSRIGCALLAAGGSRRLGFPKQLVHWEGLPLVRRAAECGLGSHCAETLVVLGAHAVRVREALGELPVTLRENQGWREGLASSVRTAALWAIERKLDGLLLTLCDQPGLTSNHLDTLLFMHRRTGMVVASHYGGRSAVPALFPAAQLRSLLKLRGDRGARELLRAHRPLALVPWPEGELDVDTQSELQRLLGPARVRDGCQQREEAS
ncbi:MAG TPA: nucleotidyltransferase family protein [Polyangiaceae bacterium]|jgi:CTP:molybdopterin cytidylyltransferase MocA